MKNALSMGGAEGARSDKSLSVIAAEYSGGRALPKSVSNVSTLSSCKLVDDLLEDVGLGVQGSLLSSNGWTCGVHLPLLESKLIMLVLGLGNSLSSSNGCVSGVGRLVVASRLAPLSRYVPRTWLVSRSFFLWLQQNFQHRRIKQNGKQRQQQTLTMAFQQQLDLIIWGHGNLYEYERAVITYSVPCTSSLCPSAFLFLNCFLFSLSS